MKHSFKIGLYFMVFSILFSSCAAPYRAIKPNLLVYHAHNNSGDVSCSYKYNVLMERRNKRYSKKEPFLYTVYIDSSQPPGKQVGNEESPWYTTLFTVVPARFSVGNAVY